MNKSRMKIVDIYSELLVKFNSLTILNAKHFFFQNLYINPQNSAKSADGSHLTNVSDEEMQEHYDNFFEDVFVEAEDK